MTTPLVIFALKAKRACLDGELLQVERQAIKLREQLDAIDRALKVFDPAINLAAIRPVVRRAAPRYFKHGQFTRAALDVLRRAERPLTCREIAKRLAADFGLSFSGPHEMRALVKKVQSAFSVERKGVKRDRDEGALTLSLE